MLAFALAAGCRLLLLDEPANGLDIPSRKQLRKLLALALREDRAIIVSTHQVHDLEALIDSIAILNAGAIVLNEGIESLTRRLYVGRVLEEPEPATVLYSEQVAGGYLVVKERVGEPETALDLETLFQAAVTDPHRLKAIFGRTDTYAKHAGSTFEIDRLLRLVRYTLWQDWRGLALGAGALVGAFVVFGPLLGMFGAYEIVVSGIYFLALGLGWIYTSATFAEIHNKLRAPRYLSLPASTAEKLAARWLVTAVAYPLGVVLLCVALHQATYLFKPIAGIHGEINGQPIDLARGPWTLFPEGSVHSLLTYLALQSVFFWGALRFPNHPFVTTILCLLGALVVLGMSRLLLNNVSIMWTDAHDQITAGTGATFQGETFFNWLDRFLESGLYLIVPPILVVLTYLNLKRSEA